MKGVVAGIAISAVLVACAGGQRMSATSKPVTATDAGLPTSRGTDRSEIERLAAEIDQQLGTTTLPPLEGPAVPMAQLPVCTPPPSDTCKTSCTLSGSICDNAQKICDLADKMPGDGWAKGKCDDATTKCDAAHKACCDCT